MIFLPGYGRSFDLSTPGNCYLELFPVFLPGKSYRMLKLTLVEQHFEINVLQVKEFGFERGIYKQIRVSNLAQGPHSSGDVFY